MIGITIISFNGRSCEERMSIMKFFCICLLDSRNVEITLSERMKALLSRSVTMLSVQM